MLGETKLPVYIAGDALTQFPALVAFASFEEHNPGLLEYYYFTETDRLDAKVAEQLAGLGVQIVNSLDLPQYATAVGLDVMVTEENRRWPAEVYLNWAVPEFLANRGRHYSLKVDFDVLCTGNIREMLDPLSDSFTCAALVTRVDPSIPESALTRIRSEVGYTEPRKFSINSGVVLLNNLWCREIGFFDTFVNIMGILQEECPILPTPEQAAIALIASNHLEGFAELPARFNQRALARVPLGYENDSRIVHFVREKPWEPFDLDAHRTVTRRGWAVLPAYRNLWLEYARKIDGFEDFTSERPYSAQDLISLVSTTLTLDREHWKEQLAEPKQQRAILNKRRRELSELVGERLDWTVSYGPLRGLKMSRDTWWSRPSRAAMFLGLYEKEILDTLLDVGDNDKVFVDIGAADGYYAVGLVASGRFDRCYCFELDERGQELIMANAEANGVADRVTVFGEANDASLDLVPAEDLARAVVMVDIEGAEFDLLTSAVFDRLADNIVIVETHPFLVKGGDAKMVELRKRSARTHMLTEMTTGARDLSKIPEVADLSDTDRWLICSEGRQQLMTWFRFDPTSRIRPLSVSEALGRWRRGEMSVGDVVGGTRRRLRRKAVALKARVG